MTNETVEWLKCSESPAYFVDNYCRIYDAIERDWIGFRLWSLQADALTTIFNNLLIVILKARQLGMTWLVLAFALWLMLFRPASTILLFSRRDTESVHLLSDRLKGMYRRLPRWMQARAIIEDNDHEFQLSNGSVARAFPTTAGDSYTASLAIVDEADLIPDLGQLMRSVKPTIDAGGRMILLSRSEKSKPQSEFKNVYRAAKQKLNDWVILSGTKRKRQTSYTGRAHWTIYTSNTRRLTRRHFRRERWISELHPPGWNSAMWSKSRLNLRARQPYQG